jgi:hypothetical protein
MIPSLFNPIPLRERWKKVREYFSGEVETPDKHFFFPSFTLNPLLGSWEKKI